MLRWFGTIGRRVGTPLLPSKLPLGTKTSQRHVPDVPSRGLRGFALSLSPFNSARAPVVHGDRTATERLRRDQLETSRAGQSALVQSRAVARDPGVDEQPVFVDQIQPVQFGGELSTAAAVGPRSVQHTTHLRLCFTSPLALTPTRTPGAPFGLSTATPAPPRPACRVTIGLPRRSSIRLATSAACM